MIRSQTHRTVLAVLAAAALLASPATSRAADAAPPAAPAAAPATAPSATAAPAAPPTAAAPPAPTEAKICLNCHKPTPGSLRGHWESVTMKATSIQLKIDGTAQILRFDPASLQVLNAPEQGDAEKMLKSIKRGHEVRIEYAQEGDTRLAKVVSVKPPVKIAPEERLGLAEIQSKVAQGPAKGKYFLFDSRPAPRFKEGAIPTAVSLPFPEFDKVAAERLPADKGALVVFYCSGLTCNMSPGSLQKAKALGYTNAKVFPEGMPAWYGAGYGVLTAQSLADAYKDLPHVLVDARKPAVAKKGFIKGAVAGTDQIVAALPDKKLKAPIIVYDEDGKGAAARLATKIVKAGYVNVNVVSDGFAGAKVAGLPVETGALASKAVFVPKPRPGELPLAEFEKLVVATPPEIVLVDVRNPDEVAEDGTIEGAVNVPVDQIDQNADKLPKDKKIVTFCGTGVRAEMAYHSLKAKGWTDVAFLNAEVEFDDGKVEFPR
jgi:rhodanese-related sulfurtransferase